MSDLSQKLREYAGYRATADDLSTTLFRAAGTIDELEGLLREYVAEAEDDRPFFDGQIKRFKRAKALLGDAP